MTWTQIPMFIWKQLPLQPLNKTKPKPAKASGQISRVATVKE